MYSVIVRVQVEQHSSSSIMMYHEGMLEDDSFWKSLPVWEVKHARSWGASSGDLWSLPSALGRCG